MILNFGKFKGKELWEVDDSYLLWLNFQTDFLSDSFLDETRIEVQRRWPDRIPVRLLRIGNGGGHGGIDSQKIKSVYRKLSREFHPDRTGGSPLAQQALNRFYEALNSMADEV